MYQDTRIERFNPTLTLLCHHLLLLLVDGPVSKNALNPLLHLLQSHDIEVQQAATTTMLKFSRNGKAPHYVCMYRSDSRFLKKLLVVL